MAFVILQISAVPDFNTLNRLYECPCPQGESRPVWEPSLVDSIADGPTGSHRCVTFYLARDKTPGKTWAPVSLAITATSAVVATWYKPPNQGPPSTFRITAGLPGRADLLVSEDIQITSPTPVPIEIKSLRPSGEIYEIPFRNAGDWQWTLQRTDISSPPILCPTKPRLELCFVFCPSTPNGPWDSDEGHRRTACDFGDQHYIDLFRLFLPSQVEIMDNTPSNATTRDRLLWYLRRAMTTLWNLGIKPHPEYPDRPVSRLDTLYPAVGGGGCSSFYLSPIPPFPRTTFHPQFGGRFELRRWIKGIHVYCTAFDLAALTQLACAIVQDAKGDEVLDSRWVCATGDASLGQRDFGHVNAGTLFGWPQFPQCNSVAFGSGGFTVYPKDQAAERVPLRWHAWVEVKLPGSDTRFVLDASQAFSDGLSKVAVVEAGTKGRGEFLVLKIDESWPDPARFPRLRPERPTRNLDAVTFYSTPVTHMHRIGVMGISTSPL